MIQSGVLQGTITEKPVIVHMGVRWPVMYMAVVCRSDGSECLRIYHHDPCVAMESMEQRVQSVIHWTLPEGMNADFCSHRVA